MVSKGIKHYLQEARGRKHFGEKRKWFENYFKLVFNCIRYTQMFKKRLNILTKLMTVKFTGGYWCHLARNKCDFTALPEPCFICVCNKMKTCVWFFCFMLLLVFLLLGRAIKHVKESIFTSEAGARRGVPKVLVVLTDGRSQDDVNKVSKEMQVEGGYLRH